MKHIFLVSHCLHWIVDVFWTWVGNHFDYEMTKVWFSIFSECNVHSLRPQTCQVCSVVSLNLTKMLVNWNKEFAFSSECVNLMEIRNDGWISYAIQWNKAHHFTKISCNFIWICVFFSFCIFVAATQLYKGLNKKEAARSTCENR